MTSLLDTRPKRLAAWGAVAVLVCWGLFNLWTSQPASAVSEPSPAELSELARLKDDQYPDWLTEFYDSLDGGGTSVQVLIIQRVPDQPPIVLASPRGSSDEEESTHWRCPWQAVQKALAEPPPEPTLVSGTHAGLDYVHHLVPLDKTGSRYLLINERRSGDPSFLLRVVVFAAAGLLTVGLLASRPEESA